MTINLDYMDYKEWKETIIMEKKYITPEMEIDTFETDDIITTSGSPIVDDSNTPGSEGWA